MNKQIEEIKLRLLDKVDEFFPKVRPNGVNKGRGESAVIVGLAIAEFTSLIETVEKEAFKDGAVAMHRYLYDDTPFADQLDSSVKDVINLSQQREKGEE